MIPVTVPVFVNDTQLGMFTRDEQGKCRVFGPQAMSQTAKNVLNLMGSVMSSEVSEDGDLPTNERLFEQLCRLGVPLYVLGALYSFPDAMLARILSVMPSMVAHRREQMLRRGRYDRVPVTVLGGGDA